MKKVTAIIAAAFLWGAAPLFAGDAFAASCCGGGGGATLVLPKISRSMIDVSFDSEKYNGYWTKTGKYLLDPAGSVLRQYRLTMGYAMRLADRWQAGITVPLVHNRNRYAGLSTSASGLGDATLGFWYEGFDDIKCIWKVRSWEDLAPAVYYGMALTVPTGISPYDNVGSSFDTTGRGFYRLDANLLLDKTVYPFNLALMAGYGAFMERPVNREYGNYVAPYHKKPGDRFMAGLTLGYTHFLESMTTITFSGGLSFLREEQGSINGAPDISSGMEKRSFTAGVAWATMDRDWVVRLTYGGTIKQDGWGSNFPATDTVSVGVSHVYR